MEKLKTSLNIEIEGTNIEYGKIPSGLVNGWNGIVYYIKTDNIEKHHEVVLKLIEQLELQSYDHGSEWRKTQVETVKCNEYCQISIVSFRVKDSY